MDVESLLKYGLSMAQKNGASYAEGRYQADLGEGLMLKNGVPELASHFNNAGVSFRVLVDGALGFAATNRVSKKEVSKVIDMAIKSAKAASFLFKDKVGLSEEESKEDKVVVKPRIKFENVDQESMIELLKEADSVAVESASKYEAKLVGRILFVRSWTTEKRIITTDGIDVYSFIPRVVFSFHVTALGPNKLASQRFAEKGESGGWEAIEKLDVVRLAKNEGEVLGKLVTQAKSPPKDKLDVVLGSEVVGIVCHESSGHPGEMDRILGREAAQAGESYLTKDSVGKVVGSNVVNVVDDPTIPHSFGFYLYDDEGVRARKRYLIKEGKINEFLQNRETAFVTGTKSNGAARASQYNREPIVRMANTYMEPGDYKFEELLEDIKFGIYIKNFTEWNIDDRRFNQRYVGLESYIIENGELKEMVRNPVIEMTTIGLFSSVDAVGSDLDFWAATCGKGDPMQGVPVWTGGPSIRLRNVNLGG